MTDSSPSKEFFSPRRYFLDAPKEQPGTCFVKNDDYADLWQSHERLQQDNARFINSHEVLRIENDALKQKLLAAEQLAVRQGNEIRRLRAGEQA